MADRAAVRAFDAPTSDASAPGGHGASPTDTDVRGTFRMPEGAREGELVVEIEERALEDLLDGIDIEPAATKPRARRLH